MPGIRFLDTAALDARYPNLIRPGASIASAASVAEHRHHYEAVTDLVELAGTLLTRVNEDHPLLDGNKRASVRLCDEFLGLNGFRLEGDSAELAAFVWAVAKERDREQAIAGLRRFVVEGPPDRPFDERYPEVITDLAR